VSLLLLLCLATNAHKIFALSEKRNLPLVRDQHDHRMNLFFSMELRPTGLTRYIAQNPFVPQSEAVREDRCDSILQMQVAGLKKRLEHSRAKTAVVGISGGLDSCWRCWWRCTPWMH